MFWKKSYRIEKKLNQINEVLKRSFVNVKRDTSNIFQWLNYFYRKNIEQEQTIKKLQSEISYIPKTRDEIKKIIDDYYSFESLVGKIKELNYRMAELEGKQHIYNEELISQPLLREPQIDISDFEKRLEILEQKKISIKEKMTKRLTRNSKEYVKSVIVSYIKKYEKISALNLKEIIVDEQSFCSKSSFYRLLNEIEDLDDIGIIKQGKEKHYVYKIKN